MVADRCLVGQLITRHIARIGRSFRMKKTHGASSSAVLAGSAAGVRSSPRGWIQLRRGRSASVLKRAYLITPMRNHHHHDELVGVGGAEALDQRERERERRAGSQLVTFSAPLATAAASSASRRF